MFGKPVDTILFINNQLVIYFVDGNRLTIDMKHSTFNSPIEFMDWLDQNGTERKSEIKVAA